MTPPLTKGTTISVRFSAVVDGDTIRVYLPSNPKAESIRLLNIDTEESVSFSSKPKTPWGLKAKSFAYSFFKGTENVELEFLGTESVDVALEKHRGLFGRVLAYVYKDGIDFQYVMTRKGYTPYFNKYGNATFASHHARYVAAEHQAQIEAIGV
ncbi:unnamed protein product [Chondrus crispus]|uniref:TNase-like domain-containing protein n=1 Tax=Chondrus crispus TaxID=2769 RepID=R7QMF0_CHOCR|nr:unnamed protein product [Chondrus crispus]CDF39279.1 unnamed protein product [Chondrus crispus]|eukprot:XP_005719190.1 unnamed protein product [Chondrus crispus]